VRIEYSRPDEIADDHLIAKLEELPASPVIVATNDRELQQRSAALGATIATSDQLLALIR
jgi:predicted RNA-binding protein with PIN domain